MGSTHMLVLDVNVLYPAPIRDLLLSLAYFRLFQPKWSSVIQDEWVRNLLVNRLELSADALGATVATMNKVFPDAEVNGFDGIIPQLDLPDPDDRHVLAAALHSQANSIVTFNLQDFPNDKLKGVRAIHPDVFVSELLDFDEETVVNAFLAQVGRLKNPPMTDEKVLEVLERCGLPKSVARLRVLLGGVS